MAVLGYESSSTATSLTGDGFAVHYDAATGFYTFDLPSTEAGKLAPVGNGTYGLYGPLVTASGTVLNTELFVYKPGSPELNLTYTTFAVSHGSGKTDPFAWMAFGSATPQGSVPVTGSATYEATVRGDDTAYPGGTIGGTATLAFDFAGGKLAGHFDPVYVDGWGTSFALGQYAFVNTIYASGSTTFSGELSNPSFTTNGSFDGLFTGPSAQELMSRWQAPYFDPYTHELRKMFGVWVGKKGP